MSRSGDIHTEKRGDLQVFTRKSGGRKHWAVPGTVRMYCTVLYCTVPVPRPRVENLCVVSLLVLGVAMQGRQLRHDWAWKRGAVPPPMPPPMPLWPVPTLHSIALVISGTRERFDTASAQLRRAGFASIVWVPGVFGNISGCPSDLSSQNNQLAHLDAWRHIAGTDVSMAVFEDDAAFPWSFNASQVAWGVMAERMHAVDARRGALWLGEVGRFMAVHSVYFTPHAVRLVIAATLLLPRCFICCIDFYVTSALCGRHGFPKILDCFPPPVLEVRGMRGTGWFVQDTKHVTSYLHGTGKKAHVRISDWANTADSNATSKAAVYFRPKLLVVVSGSWWQVREGWAGLRRLITSNGTDVHATVFVADSQDPRKHSEGHAAASRATVVHSIYNAFAGTPMVSMRFVNTSALGNLTLAQHVFDVRAAWDEQLCHVARRYDQLLVVRADATLNESINPSVSCKDASHGAIQNSMEIARLIPVGSSSSPDRYAGFIVCDPRNVFGFARCSHRRSQDSFPTLPASPEAYPECISYSVHSAANDASTFSPVCDAFMRLSAAENVNAPISSPSFAPRLTSSTTSRLSLDGLQTSRRIGWQPNVSGWYTHLRESNATGRWTGGWTPGGAGPLDNSN